MTILLAVQCEQSAEYVFNYSGEERVGYRCANEWGLTDAGDRLNFCRHTYLYGLEFDEESHVRAALTGLAESGDTYMAVMGRIPAPVWGELERARGAREQSASHVESTYEAS